MSDPNLGYPVQQDPNQQMYTQQQDPNNPALYSTYPQQDPNQQMYAQQQDPNFFAPQTVDPYAQQQYPPQQYPQPVYDPNQAYVTQPQPVYVQTHPTTVVTTTTTSSVMGNGEDKQTYDMALLLLIAGFFFPIIWIVVSAFALFSHLVLLCHSFTKSKVQKVRSNCSNFIHFDPYRFCCCGHFDHCHKRCRSCSTWVFSLEVNYIFLTSNVTPC